MTGARPVPPGGARLWVAGARPRTLPAAVVPVAVGTGAAVGVGGGVAWGRAALALVVAVALQVGVNYANDHADGVRGTDADRVGPLRLVGSGLVPAGQVKRAAIAAFAVAAVAGLVLAALAGWWLVIVGVSAIAAAWGYTGGPRPYGYAGLGELFVFAYFGVVATAGTTYVQVERVTGLALLVSVAVGAMATALLVTNNLRDIPGDTRAGKRTLAVRLGAVPTRRLYVALVAAALLVGATAAPARPWALISLGAAGLAVGPVRTVLAGARGPALVAVLAATGRLQLVWGALLTAGLAAGA